MMSKDGAGFSASLQAKKASRIAQVISEQFPSKGEKHENTD